MAPNYHPLSLCLLDFVFIWWNPELINFICMHKVHTQMLSFLGQQLRQYHNTKKSNLTSFLTHWALLLVFTKDHIWDLQQEKVKIYKKKKNPEPGLETVCPQSRFCGCFGICEKALHELQGLWLTFAFFFFLVIIILSSALKRGPREFAESWQGSSYNAYNRRNM